ncbi:hypothetical protein THAOC_20445, partial [Thalassiosira oceanica]
MGGPQDIADTRRLASPSRKNLDVDTAETPRHGGFPVPHGRSRPGHRHGTRAVHSPSRRTPGRAAPSPVPRPAARPARSAGVPRDASRVPPGKIF